VADGVYETLLDGMELQEFRRATGHETLHYLFIDSRLTWWLKGRSYLCRLVDLMHMGYAHEVIFGKEVVSRVPAIVRHWLTMLP
jgi:hypothetical protein